MSKGWSAALLASVLMIGSPAHAEAELPADPNICVSPLEWGDAGGPPYAAISIHDHPQFIPGHPTPIFLGSGSASYIDRDGGLRAHPSPRPDYLDGFYLGADGKVYWPLRSRDEQVLVFDGDAGYFKNIDCQPAPKRDPLSASRRDPSDAKFLSGDLHGRPPFLRLRRRAKAALSYRFARAFSDQSGS